MTDRAALERALAACEQATEGSRELSDTIMLAVGWRHEIVVMPTGRKSFYPFWISPNDPTPSPIAPDPSRSLDDAMTLMPEGWNVANVWESINPKDRPWWGCSLRRDEPYKVVQVLGAETEIKARVLATLKARLAGMEKEAEMERAELGVDGNRGFALLGDDIQSGEAEFVEIALPIEASKDPKRYHNSEWCCAAKRAAHGTVTVPREPTEAMINALYGPYLSPTAHTGRLDAWRDMVTTALTEEKPDAAD